jgi:F-type H+-transporting ATPase subunit b
VPPSPSVLAASSSGKFLITPSGGLMIWTLVVFVISMLLLWKYAFPPIRDALDRRQKAIDDSIDHAEQTRQEADKILAEYRERLKEAREQAEEIVSRARRTAEDQQREASEQARADHERQLEQTRRDIETETRRAIGEIRDEVASLTIQAAEKVLQRALSADDQRRLVDDALGDLDFSVLASEN